jgi:hypothetical protein
MGVGGAASADMIERAPPRNLDHDPIQLNRIMV